MSAQNTIEWMQERRGFITSSQVHRIMAEPKTKAAKEAGELSDGAKTYIMELIAEEMGLYKPDIETDAMRWGHEHESLARWHYTRMTGIEITVPHFIKSAKLSGYGGSPDGFSDGVVYEVKCPYNTAIHLKYILSIRTGVIPDDHYWQCVSNAHLMGVNKVTFITFDPRINHQIGSMSLTLNIINDDVDRMLTKIESALAYKKSVMSGLGLI